MPVPNWGLIANPDFNQQQVKSVYFFAGDWNSLYNPMSFCYVPPPGPNDGLYTVHPANGQHLGWSVNEVNRKFAVGEMVRAGANVVAMSYWGVQGSDRWTTSAPMQCSTCAHNELFIATANKPLLIMPAIEGGAQTKNSPAFDFEDDFPPAVPTQSALFAQILDLIQRYLIAPQNDAWPSRWLQLYDQDGTARFAVYIIHTGSHHKDLQPDGRFHFSREQHQEFAAGFDAMAEAIFLRTQKLVGFVLDALVRPVIGGQNAKGNYYPVSAYPDCIPDAAPYLQDQKSVLAIQGFIPEISLSAERTEAERLDFKKKYVMNWPKGFPVYLDLTLGYDAHLVFQTPPYTPSTIYGNNGAWQRELLKLLPHSFKGVACNTWNGYTEGYALVPTTEYGESAFRWIQRVTRTWFDIIPGYEVGGKTVTALWQTAPLLLRLFVAGTDGTVRTIWWEPDREWTFWASVPNDAQIVPMEPGAEVTALWSIENQHLDLFVADHDGVVWSISWNNLAGWNEGGWFSIHPETRMNMGAPVTAVWSDSAKHLDLFVVDQAGVVWGIWWNPTEAWRSAGWFTLHPDTKMGPGAVVTAVWSDSGNHLDLFAVDQAGVVWSIWWNPANGWRSAGWFTLHSETKMGPGAKVTAVWSDQDKHLDLFAADQNGAVWSIWWDTGGWRVEGWVTIHPETKVNPGATVTALWGDPDKHLDLFATGPDGTAWSIWWNDTEGWRLAGWFPIGDSSTISPGAAITALYSPGTSLNHLDLFTVGKASNVESAYWEPELAW